MKPKLTEEKRNPFTTPENYFEMVKEEVDSVVAKDLGCYKGERSAALLWRVLRPQLALVTAFAMLFLSFYFIFNLTGKLDNPKHAKEEVILGGVDDLNEITPLPILSFDEIEAITKEGIKVEISREEMMEYLEDNVDLITLLYIDF